MTSLYLHDVGKMLGNHGKFHDVGSSFAYKDEPDSLSPSKIFIISISIKQQPLQQQPQLPQQPINTFLKTQVLQHLHYNQNSFQTTPNQSKCSSLS